MSDYQTNKLQVFEDTIKNILDLQETLECTKKKGTISCDEKRILAWLTVILEGHKHKLKIQ